MSCYRVDVKMPKFPAAVDRTLKKPTLSNACRSTFYSDFISKTNQLKEHKKVIHVIKLQDIQCIHLFNTPKDSEDKIPKRKENSAY
jgi:hypothetical protein